MLVILRKIAPHVMANLKPVVVWSEKWFSTVLSTEPCGKMPEERSQG